MQKDRYFRKEGRRLSCSREPEGCGQDQRHPLGEPDRSWRRGRPQTRDWRVKGVYTEGEVQQLQNAADGIEGVSVFTYEQEEVGIDVPEGSRYVIVSTHTRDQRVAFDAAMEVSKQTPTTG